MREPLYTPLISLVVPFYNEGEAVEHFFDVVIPLMTSIDAISRWSTIRNGWLCRVMVDGWQAVQIPAGQGACVPLGHGAFTV